MNAYQHWRSRGRWRWYDCWSLHLRVISLFIFSLFQNLDDADKFSVIIFKKIIIIYIYFIIFIWINFVMPKLLDVDLLLLWVGIYSVVLRNMMSTNIVNISTCDFSFTCLILCEVQIFINDIGADLSNENNNWVLQHLVVVVIY